jgi:hypothetical protein
MAASRGRNCGRFCPTDACEIGRGQKEEICGGVTFLSRLQRRFGSGERRFISATRQPAISSREHQVALPAYLILGSA